MLGFLIGTACLVGLIGTIWGGQRCRPGGIRRRTWLRYVFERLDTGPGQEKAIVAALERVTRARRELFQELDLTRKDVARAMAGEVLDQAIFDEMFARHDRTISALREAVRESLGEVHESLDAGQRKVLAALIENGGRSHSCTMGGSACGPCAGPMSHGPYRNANAT